MPNFSRKQSMIERLLELTKYITEAHFDFFPDFKITKEFKNGFRDNQNLHRNMQRMVNAEVLTSKLMTTLACPVRYKKLYHHKRDKCEFTGKDRWEHDFGMFQISASLAYWLEFKEERNVQISYTEKLGAENIKPDLTATIDNKYKFYFEYERSRTANEIVNKKIPQYEKMKLDNARVVFVVADVMTNSYTLKEKEGADKEKVEQILSGFNKLKEKPKQKYLFVPYSQIVHLDKPIFYLPDGNKRKLL